MLDSNKVYILDGAMGTQIQDLQITKTQWNGVEGCNETLNASAPEVVSRIYYRYLLAGADIIKTNTFGALPWVLDDYDLADKTYDLAYEGARLARKQADAFSTADKPRYVAGDIGPGTKLPSLGHIDYDTLYEGTKTAAQALAEGGVDLFLLETCQDPLQIKAALNACRDAAPQIPIMVSATIELSGTMLIGTDAATLATILEPFNIFSLGFNCGTGPGQYGKHLEALAKVWNKPISIHANAGLPQNRGGHTYYPMGPDEFASLQKQFLDYSGVSILGGCCGTTPQHITALAKAVTGHVPTKPKGFMPRALASLYESVSLKQDPAPLLIGERSNATGSKAFRNLLLDEDYEGTLQVAQEQVRAGAHVLDVSVGFAGRDETKDMDQVFARYKDKVSIPLMPDSTQPAALETALKHIGGKPIINSVNLEDGEEKFDQICALAKRHGSALICLTIDEKGMAKTRQRKLEVAGRIYDLAVNRHGMDPGDLVFDLLTFTVGSGDAEYKDAAVQTIEAIREFNQSHPQCGTVLGLSNISFGLDKDARKYLNSVFLHHCLQAGMSAVIINVKHILPLSRMEEEDIKVCEDLLFNTADNALFTFIDHFKDKEGLQEETSSDENLSDEEKITKYLFDGNKEAMITHVKEAIERLDPQRIVNEILIDGMKSIGKLFGEGKMQLPFVLQSAETMKATVDYLTPYLPKKEKKADTTLVIGTVKGDVHDVGKNLVDIILSNNGFKVINLGIKVGIEEFIEAIDTHQPDAVGMSGLLVKSTQVMKESLQILNEKGYDLPVLLGGAALTTNFVQEYCRPIYKGPIFYCKDAFDGVTAMGRIEKGDSDTQLHEKIEKQTPQKPAHVMPKYEDIAMPKPYTSQQPPFWGRRVMPVDKALAFDWINEKMLFKQRWGFKGKDLSKEQKQKQMQDVITPKYLELKRLFLDELFEPTVIYGYFACEASKDDLIVYDENNKAHVFDFQRQQKPPFRAISDFYLHETKAAFSIVSAGAKISAYEQKLYDAGNFSDYYFVHGLGAELAEALAEIAHKQIRLDLGIDTGSIRNVNMTGYQGARYSFGYPACPDLELNEALFALLKPEEHGITLSQTHQIVPEQSTSALVCPHPEANYFNI
ncbi:MAG: methionine synthase [Campylobacterota bacterium]